MSWLQNYFLRKLTFTENQPFLRKFLLRKSGAIRYIVVIYTGDTYYVLTKSLTCGTYWLWNPSTGEFYDQHDTNCTLISIGCVFNARNVSCNDDTLMLHANLHD